MSDDTLSNRTYLMSPRAKSIMDNAAIMLPGYSKTEVMNTAIFLLGNEISRRRNREGGRLSVKAAFEEIRDELGRVGYLEILLNVVPDHKSQTRLDKFLDGDDENDDGLAEMIVKLITTGQNPEEGGSDE